MSTTAAIVGAAVLVKAVLIGALVMQRRRNRHDEEMVEEQKRLTHLARVSIVGELSGGIAHELNQPLTSILSNAQAAQQALARDKVDVRELREILDDIVAEDKRAGALIDRLRRLLKREESSCRAVCMQTLIRETVCLVRSRLTANHVKVDTHIGAELPAVHGDPVQLQQVLLNLLINACDALSEADAVDRCIDLDARLDASGQFVYLQVRDRGPGIGSDGLERVFDAFFTTKANGLGLGLAICRQIVASHGGSLWATHNDDRGAAFHVTLPVKETGIESDDCRH